MSFNGSGTFLINSTGQPVVANTVISATVFNALTADLASGLTNCITKDGQSTPTANIPMGSNKITGLAVGTLINDAATLGQVQSTAAKLIGSISGVDTVLGIMSPTLTAYAAGQLFYYIAAGANTGAVTLNIDGLGAKAVTRDGASALAAGDINSGEIVVVIYDGTRFQMINAANSFGNTTINGTLTVTGNTGLQANVSITSTLSVGGTFAVTGAATLGSTLAVTGKADLPTVSTASINAAVAVVTTGTVTNLTSTSASIASVNAGVALLTTATVTDLTASSASIASANIGNLQFTAASIASINAGVAVVTNLTATSASIASANVGTAVITTGTVTNLTSTSASIASANAAVALVTTGTVTNLTSTSASIASANLGTAVVTTGTVTNLTATSASIASANAGTAVVTNLTATGASIASANVGTGVVTALTVTGASVASANVGTAVITTLTATGASVASINAGVALVTTGTVTNLTSTTASIASANIGVAAIGTLSFTGASIASLNAGTATITTGNLTFSSTGQRITGDMANATHSSRLLFQNSGANLPTLVGALPNGSSVTSGFVAYGGSTATDTATVSVVLNGGTDARISSGILGTGTYLPMTFYTGGSERMRLDTSGNLGIGTTTIGLGGTATRLQVANANIGTLNTQANLMVTTTDAQAANVGGIIGLGGSVATASPTANMRLFGAIRGAKDDATDGNTNGYLAFYTMGSGTTTASERMRIDSSGNVGIGTASAGFNSAGLPLIVGSGSGNTGMTIFSGNASSGSIHFGDTVSTGADSYRGFLNYNHSTNTMQLGTDATARINIDSSGNVGIGGTAGAGTKVNALGTLPSSSTNTTAFGADGTIPSTTTNLYSGFTSGATTQATAFTLSAYQHFRAAQTAFGAGSTVTNQQGFFAASSLTGATNNYGFFGNLNAAANSWNFYAAGTARNYFAGRTDVGNTRIEATNNWSGVKIYSETGVSVADGATVTLTNTVCGAVTINVYETTSGDGGTFFANYSGTVTKLAGDGAATDTGSTFAVYKSAGSHTLTLKNKYGNTRGFRVSVIGAYVE